MKRTPKEAIASILANLEMAKEFHHAMFVKECQKGDRGKAFSHLDKKRATQDAIDLILTETQGIES